MKKLIVLTMMISLVGLSLNAQTYCNVTTALTYSSNMPGITNFTLNTINRTSAAIECTGSGCNSYVNTGETTTLELGQTYTISITHTEDTVLFPGDRNNIRVWIDYNNNGSWNDAGETVVSMDLEFAGTTFANFTVPLTATLGTTGMRITAKMSPDGGHIAPTPCDIPADPIGYHGEIEDYSVTISSVASGIEDNFKGNTVSVFPNPGNGLIYVESEAKFSSIEIMNILGNRVYFSEVNAEKAEIDLVNEPKGMYFYRIITKGTVVSLGKFSVE